MNKIDSIFRGPFGKWGAAVTPDNVKRLFLHPRPQMQRPPHSWHSLNGPAWAAPSEYGFGPAKRGGHGQLLWDGATHGPYPPA